MENDSIYKFEHLCRHIAIKYKYFIEYESGGNVQFSIKKIPDFDNNNADIDFVNDKINDICQIAANVGMPFINEAMNSIKENGLDDLEYYCVVSELTKISTNLKKNAN